MSQTGVAHLIFLVIGVVQFVDISVTLKLGDRGVCKGPVNNITGVLAMRENVQHTFFRNKSSGTGGRIRRSVLQDVSSPNTDMMIQPVCCQKFYYDPDLDQCLPLCSLGCINGECVDVDTCECKPPLTLVNGACVQPVCGGCEHGTCVAAGVCKCDAGYVTQAGSCQPVCSSVCVNGRCVAPDRCHCNPGHAPDPRDAFRCTPVCDPPCVNGSCAAHNKCLCSAGYEPTADSSVCRPACAGCQHGHCLAPNQCVCSVGYDRINSTCKPHCSSCSNGDCIAPGQCQCHEGYELKGEDCVPICSPPCNNGQCLAYNKCLCKRGYNKTDKGCKPYCCKSGCDYRHCNKPNHRTKGHKRKISTRKPAGPFSILGIAGIDGTWVAIAIGGLFLLLLIIVMTQLLCTRD